MQDHKNITVLIPAAGFGERAGQPLPKQYIQIGGKTILCHSVEKIRASLPQAHICVIIDPNYTHLAQESLNAVDNLSFCNGEKTRKQSIYNGLQSLSQMNRQDIILIHDAARPFVRASDIHALIKALETAEAASLCTPAHNTMCRGNNQTSIQRYEPRENLYNILTPQGFHYGSLMEAHEQFKEDGAFTDDSALLHAAGVTVALVNGSPHNFKITTAEDLELAMQLLKQKTIIRSGTGFDVHAFDEEPASFIRLGGIDIPFDKKLKGHSDADVLLHTVTDALLGAIGAGDIGDHFPPSDPQWKGKDSAYFLECAGEMLKEKGAQILSIDLTAICEAPKLFAYKQPIKERIAQILNIPASRINVKATTTEKLGFTGRGEGIAAQAIATIEAPEE